MRTGRQCSVLVATAAVLLAGPSIPVSQPALACDAPVYEYALQNWEPDPYHAYYFFKGRADAQDTEANKLLEKVAKGQVGHANLDFSQVNVKTSGGDLRVDIWKRHAAGKLPVHVVLTPTGLPIFVGKLTAEAVKLLIDSPKRAMIADLLCRGKQGVLLLLRSGSAGEDRRARRAVEQALAEAKRKGTNAGFVEVSRNDRAEWGLVRALLQVEHGLEKTNAPVLYGVFGRGHVLEPFVGAAITLDNALQLIAYMNGPCTCELKAANPGMDLLTSVNWAERTAAAAPVRDRPEPSFIMGFVGESGYAEFELRPAQEGEGMSPGTESPTGFGQPTSTSVPPPGTPSPAELNRPDLELNTIGGEAGRNRLSTAEPSQATVRPKSASPGPAGPAEVDRPKKPAVPSVPASPPVRESSLAAQGIANAEVGTDTELQLLAINRPPDAPAPEAEAARSQLIPLVGLSLAFLAIIALAGGTVMLLRRSGAHR